MSGSSSDSKPNAGLANSLSNVFKLVSVGWETGGLINLYYLGGKRCVFKRIQGFEWIHKMDLRYE